MTRGNQREQDRLRAQKKKPKEGGSNLKSREKDAEKVREKQREADKKAEEAAKNRIQEEAQKKAKLKNAQTQQTAGSSSSATGDDKVLESIPPTS